MKLRIQANSIRLRLGPRELQRLVREGQVEESTSFGPAPAQRFSYALQTSQSAQLQATFENGRLSVRLPRALLDRWAASDQVGIEATQPVADGAILTILLEKDFECLDQSHASAGDDVFGHPRQSAPCSLKVPTA